MTSGLSHDKQTGTHDLRDRRTRAIWDLRCMLAEPHMHGVWTSLASRSACLEWTTAGQDYSQAMSSSIDHASLLGPAIPKISDNQLQRLLGPPKRPPASLTSNK